MSGRSILQNLDKRGVHTALMQHIQKKLPSGSDAAGMIDRKSGFCQSHRLVQSLSAAEYTSGYRMLCFPLLHDMVNLVDIINV